MRPRILAAFLFLTLPLHGQDSAKLDATIGADGTGHIVVEAHGTPPEAPLFFSTKVESVVTINQDRILTEATVVITRLQGDQPTFRLALRGTDRIVSVVGDTIASWAAGLDTGNVRFLAITTTPSATEAKEHRFVVRLESEIYPALPVTTDLTHLAPLAPSSASFDSIVTVNFANGTTGRLLVAEGFQPLANPTPGSSALRQQSSTGGRLSLQITRSGLTPEPLTLSDMTLTGQLEPNGKTAQFTLRGSASVSLPDASINILSGRVALTAPPLGPARVDLSGSNGTSSLRLVYPYAGTFPLEVTFVAPVTEDGPWQRLDFTVGSSAVTPLSLSGLTETNEFSENTTELLPEFREGLWLGFLPAGGRAHLAWKPSRPDEEGNLFFTTTALIEARLGAGLLRQDHEINYQILQGELKQLLLDIAGDGEIVAVSGSGISAWNVVKGGDGQRHLAVALGRPLDSTASLTVTTQTPLTAFPVTAEALRLTPRDAVRHAGHLRLSNLGSVRLEPSAKSGLNQLSPEQFPGDALEARQIFVYRFPSADYQLGISADRVQPEVGVSQLVVHELTETERRISADLEFDIREAPVREWSLEFPDGYSLVSANGAALVDYLVASEAVDGRKTLTLLFDGEVQGRQLVSLVLEKSEAAAAGPWVLPRLEFPAAKSMRGDLAVAAAHGFRLTTSATEALVEKPLSYFPKPTPLLQQAFRIREPNWSATMTIEPLEKSVQADVFHLYSLSEGNARASVVLNYFVTGAPVSEWEISVPADLSNVAVEGQNVRTWRREEDKLIVSLHQPVIGPSTLLVTFLEAIPLTGGPLLAGRVAPLGVTDERGYVEIVSPGQVQVDVTSASPELLALDPLELPAEFRLLAAAPAQSVWQYTARPFELAFQIGWFEPGSTVPQVVEFADASTRVSRDGEAITDLLYFVKSRTRNALDLTLPTDTRLWSVTVAGETVNARQDGAITRIPLPGAGDPDTPVEVRLRLGRETSGSTGFSLGLPQVAATVLKTEWRLSGDENRVLYPVGGTVAPPHSVRVATGFTGVIRHGLLPLFGILVLACGGVILTDSRQFYRRLLGLAALTGAVIVAVSSALVASQHNDVPGPLTLSLPLLPEGSPVELALRSVPAWQASLSWFGLILGIAGVAGIVIGRRRNQGDLSWLMTAPGVAAILAGLLCQRGSEAWFFILLATLLIVAWLWPRARDTWQDRPRKKKAAPVSAAISILILAGGLTLDAIPASAETVLPGYSLARSFTQQASLPQGEAKLHVTAEGRFSGKMGDSFLLLRSPAVLTSFAGPGLNLSRTTLEGGEFAYLVTLSNALGIETIATFSYDLPVPDGAAGFALPTGPAAFAQIEIRHDQAEWEFVSPQAIRSSPLLNAAPGESGNILLFATGESPTLTLQPKARDLAAEKALYYVEADQLFLPGPGVLDGKHRFRIKPARGRIGALELRVPAGLTVSEVTGPIGSWQFDADAGSLSLTVEPAASTALEILVTTQRGLDALPTDLTLSPIRVLGAAGEIGLLALAFGPEAQPENPAANGMSEVNPGDFDSSLLPGEGTLLSRVYRYGAEPGELILRVNPVAPEVRVTSRQVLSFGEERLVLAVDLTVEITRAGLFQLGFDLPDGLEIESLSGSALRTWSEVGDDASRSVVLYLNGRTLGTQTFSLTLAGTTPTGEEDWTVPNIQLKEASRQTGQLVVRPAEGIRLRTAERTNLSEADPRELGGDARDALAYRLLQRDWSLSLGVEKLDPWITGQVLHTTTLREGQTRTSLVALLKIENAAIRELRVHLPGLGEAETRTLRASGPSVGDLVRVAPDSDAWDIRLQRRLIGEARIQLEYESRGERADGKESLVPVIFPEVKQPTYFCAVRSAGRLELATGDLPDGWQNSEWSALPAALREASGDRSTPALTLRANAPEAAAVIEAKRHSLAKALKLRVTEGRLTTLLSTAGDELTSVDLSLDVVQRGSLQVGLPPGGELFHLFVNGENVHFVREGDAWRFFIVPGADGRRADVRFAYIVPSAKPTARPGRVNLVSPSLAVPMENLLWEVSLPPGMELDSDSGDLELVELISRSPFDQTRYSEAARVLREEQNQRATALLDQANSLIQSGDNNLARQALSSVANGFASDAASNEDARVQLENLRTQQAVVGLNTRRQRLVLDQQGTGAESVISDQLRQGAAANRVLTEGDLNYRPEEISQLLQGNNDDENAGLTRIAGKIVRQQEGEEPLARPMGLVLPSEGQVYRFQRALQVAESAPLELNLGIAPLDRLVTWRVFLGLGLIGGLALFFSSRLAPYSE